MWPNDQGQIVEANLLNLNEFFGIANPEAKYTKQ